MKLEQALKKAASVPRGFHSKQGRKLLSGLKKEFNAGRDVHGKKFQGLSDRYKELKRKGKAHPLQISRSGRANMELTGELFGSQYFNTLRFKNKNSWETTTGLNRAGTKALAHSGKIKRPKGLPIRAIVGDQELDDVVHPKLKKKFAKAYAKRIFGQLKRIPKKEFL